MYIFDGNAIVINIQAESGDKKLKYPDILKSAVLFTLVLFIFFASTCYYVYRDHTQPIFTMSLVPVNGLVICILTCVCINALTSYPIQILAAFAIIEKLVFSSNNGASTHIALMKRIVLRSAIIIFTTLICMVIKTFTDFINIAGALGSATVSFVLP